MKLEEMKRIGDARTKGEWKSSGPSFYDKNMSGVTVDNAYLISNYIPYEDSGVPIEDAAFIAMAANNWDKLMNVVEAAKRVLANIPGPQNGLFNLHEALETLEKE